MGRSSREESDHWPHSDFQPHPSPVPVLLVRDVGALPSWSWSFLEVPGLSRFSPDWYLLGHLLFLLCLLAISHKFDSCLCPSSFFLVGGFCYLENTCFHFSVVSEGSRNKHVPSAVFSRDPFLQYSRTSRPITSAT